MTGQDDVNLTTEERAVLADLEAGAAQDQRLARHLAGRRHRALRGVGFPGWARSLWWAISLVVAGLALTMLSLSVSPLVGSVGVLATTMGLWRIALALGRRWPHKGRETWPR